MPRPIEDYALIGDLHTAALVGADGSVDWLCLPRFDSSACFAALLGGDRHGHWRIGPAAGGAQVSRRYLPGTLILETEFSDGAGAVRLTDCMPPRRGDPALLRLVEGIRGSVELRMTFAPRFEFGSAQPRITGQDGAHCLTAGAQALWLFGPVHLRTRHGMAIAEFRVGAGEQLPLAAIWRPAGHPAPPAPAVPALIRDTGRWWAGWTAALDGGREWREPVIRSLITLKALSYAPTGALVAAPTTSLPQQASGTRNWDYRYCWLRDAAAALPVLLASGARSEAAALMGFVGRAVAGRPDQVQPVYGVDGRRWLPETELPWLPGYDSARPVRTGTAAAAQRHLAVFGDVLAAQLAARASGIPAWAGPWEAGEVLGLLESAWQEPDPGAFEMRGPPQQFVFSKVMIWAAADAAVQLIERFGDGGPAWRWRRLRAQVRAEVLGRGYDTGAATFVNHYAGAGPDASLLRLAPLGFLPASDQRLAGTIAAAQQELDRGGVLLRYRPDAAEGLDGTTPAARGGYLPASCWLAQCHALAGHAGQARSVFGQLLGLRNDVGLLPEEYDPLRRRFAGNFPLSASHAALVATAVLLESAAGLSGPPGFALAGRGPAGWAP